MEFHHYYVNTLQQSENGVDPLVAVQRIELLQILDASLVVITAKLAPSALKHVTNSNVVNS